MSKKKQQADDLEIPAFLRREAGDPALRRAVVDRIINPARTEWVMSSSNKSTEGTSEMAKKKTTKAAVEAPSIECEDPALPVEVNFTLVGGGVERMKFENINEFTNWFDDEHHIIEGSVASGTLTMISVKAKLAEPEEPLIPEVLEDPEKIGKVVKGSKAKKATPPPAAPPAASKKATPAAKKAAPVPAKGKAAPPPAAPVSRGAVVKKTEGNPNTKPRGTNFVRHGVKVGGVQYKSAWEAFQKLNLGTASECVKLRTTLKTGTTGKATFEKGGKKYNFELVELS